MPTASGGTQPPIDTNQMYVLKDPESWHGQKAGPKGAIVTEVATYHNHVTFSKPGMEFKNTGD